MKTIIKNGRVVTAVDDYRADILIEDGTVSLIGSEITVEQSCLKHFCEGER